MRKVLGISAAMLSLVLASSLSAKAPGSGYGHSGKVRPDPSPIARPTYDHHQSYIVHLTDAPKAQAGDRGTRMLLGATSPDHGMVAGVGLFRVPKMDANDPNRAIPIRSSEGKSQRIAAVGLSLAF